MLRALATMRRNLQNMRKSPRVADETMFGDGNEAEFPIFRHQRRQRWSGLSLLCSIVHAPFSLLGCFSTPQISSTDGFWMSSDLARTSDVNHLMVNDSMRYAILM